MTKIKMMVVTLIVTLFAFQFNAYSDIVQEVRVYGYPLTYTITVSPSGDEVHGRDCGPDESLICYTFIDNRSSGGYGMLEPGDNFDIYIDGEGIGYINAQLLEPFNILNPSGFKIKIISTTQVYNNYNDWINAVNQLYN